jgi:threonine synthase
MPETFPSWGPDVWKALPSMSYAEIAALTIREFAGDSLSDEVLKELCEDAYNFPVPLEPVEGQRQILRLDQGPTASFKDFAARAMARLMSQFLQEDQRRLLILTATSGDTGSAIAHAFHKVEGIEVIVLFPRDEVSLRQRKQMTTLGDNITTFAIDGKFDDCQAFVKRAFADDSLATLPLSSANSINIGRLVPQIVYYLYAYSRFVEPGQEIVVSVPSGNFGNMMGLMLARKLGLPLKRCVVAVNANDEFPTFLHSGEYEKIEPSRNCLSNAMNVGHPSNLARLVHLFGGQMDETGKLHEMPDLEAMRSLLFSTSVSDETTQQTIREVYDRTDVLLEPHGAVAWAGFQAFAEAYPEEAALPTLVVETAHPAKVPTPIEEVLSITPTVPPSLAAVETKEETYEELPGEYEDFRQRLLERVVRYQ